MKRCDSVVKRLEHHIRSVFDSAGSIALHEPIVGSREKDFLGEVIDSTFISTVGQYVDRFENELEQYLPVTKAVSTINGTAALHAALYCHDVSQGDLVIMPPFTFVATANAVAYLGAKPVFIDISSKTLGLCPTALAKYLERSAYIDSDGFCRHIETNEKFSACIVVHAFGHSAEMDDLNAVCRDWHLPLIEDASQALGSQYNGKKIGSQSECATFSFNGNKIISTGAGGAVVTNSIDLGNKIKHLSTTARLPGPEIEHDQIAFNYRMPNINAALGCAQMERLNSHLQKKRKLAACYAMFFEKTPLTFFSEPKGCQSNYWLNTVVCNDKNERDDVIDYLNTKKIGVRPAWKLLSDLPMYAACDRGDLSTAKYYYERVVCLPSSPI